MDKGIGTRQRDPDHGDRLKLFRQGIHTGDHRDPECRFHTRGCESQDDECLQEVSERPEDDQGLLRKEDHSGSQKSSKDEGGSCVDQSVVQCETGSKSRRDGPERNGDDPEYYLDDEICEFDIFYAYYVLDEYRLFLEECEKAKEYCDLSEGPYYFGLWTMNQHDQFHREVDKQRTEILACIENAKMDEDFDSEEEKQDYIKSWEDDLENLNLLEHKIKDENYKPMVELKLWPIYGCYLIDCLIHNL